MLGFQRSRASAVGVVRVALGDAQRGFGAPLRGARPRLGARCFGDRALGVGDVGARVGEGGLELGDPPVGVVESLLRVAAGGLGVAHVVVRDLGAFAGLGERGCGPAYCEVVAGQSAPGAGRVRRRAPGVTWPGVVDVADVAEEPDGR